jgi:hypothetical protein
MSETQIAVNCLIRAAHFRGVSVGRGLPVVKQDDSAIYERVAAAEAAVLVLFNDCDAAILATRTQRDRAEDKAEAWKGVADKLAREANEVMQKLEQHGPSIVPHLMGTDENAGQRLRDALAEYAKMEGKHG